MKRAFTLVEVNLAIFIMATGVLAMVALYSLGFRESRQSEEDVAAAGYADAFFAPLVATLASTNMTWQDWQDIGDTPSGNSGGGNDPKLFCDGITQNGEGWGAYARNIGDEKTASFRVQDCNTLAERAFDDIIRKGRGAEKGHLPSQKPDYYGLVATRRGGTIALSFRCSRRKDLLMSQPMYYTEVHFQGRTDQ